MVKRGHTGYPRSEQVLRRFWPKKPKQVSIVGSVVRQGDELVLLIPLAVGGDVLAEYAKGISEVRGEHLRVPVPSWLAEKLGIREGSQVIVDNFEGKFRITRDD